VSIEKLFSKSRVIDGATSHSTKPASVQVAGYPAQAGIQQTITSRVADKNKMQSRFAGIFFNHLDSRLRGNDESVGLSE
jgi:hypothetical protein